ncbi:imidazoleglycerol-phosphate dehydratase HisB [Lachnoclostridium sp. MSJ-17]|uniref:imidazoleglycerol-phosphate dehydratase HisB n=1 Tax=Lachnoclostridium sp. MSJ-17 TaxID=2841516 RepID=UPI001C11EBE2|nr:imidazoleglycerol-phosphate dehydratase HisB [Lachnoclostridium sp. MSJ-17]MBU5461527.1 imidazoleglycerol-phosphate dehydratase HisB [Lachnoclostridium sp. MSJ-17]
MRTATVNRKTKETDIRLSLCLDGGEVSIDTGVGFFNHMLNSFATHGGFGLTVEVEGDLEVDEHHTVEDTGIVLGKAFAEALGDKGSIERFGSFYVPMDEALAFASVDVSGRPFLVFDADFPQVRCGDYDCAMTVEFMRAFAFNAGITLHLKSVYGDNSHHITEALFKAAAHAMRLAVKQNASGKPLSTKGVL